MHQALRLRILTALLAAGATVGGYTLIARAADDDKHSTRPQVSAVRYSVLQSALETCTVTLDHGASAGGCSPVDEARSGGVATGLEACLPSLPSGTVRVTALVPDGIAEVEFVVDSARSTTVPVKNNTAVIETPNIPDTVRWVADGQEHTAPVAGANVPIPEKCAPPEGRQLAPRNERESDGAAGAMPSD